jgi:hypothetical protein
MGQAEDELTQNRRPPHKFLRFVALRWWWRWWWPMDQSLEILRIYHAAQDWP